MLGPLTSHPVPEACANLHPNLGADLHANLGRDGGREVYGGLRKPNGLGDILPDARIHGAKARALSENKDGVIQRVAVGVPPLQRGESEAIAQYLQKS